MKRPEDKSRRFFLKASSMLGLAATFSPATLGEAFEHSKPGNPLEENTMAKSGVTPAADNSAIRPFHINFPESEIAD